MVVATAMGMGAATVAVAVHVAAVAATIKVVTVAVPAREVVDTTMCSAKCAARRVMMPFAVGTDFTTPIRLKTRSLLQSLAAAATQLIQTGASTVAQHTTSPTIYIA